MNYDEFIGQVQNVARLGTLGDAVRATRATLETLAERLTLDEVKDLASQLPSEIAYYMRQTAGFLDKFGLNEFFRRISQREQTNIETATYHARVVMSVLQNAVTRGEIGHMRDELPDEFAPLFESGPEGEFKKAA